MKIRIQIEMDAREFDSASDLFDTINSVLTQASRKAIAQIARPEAACKSPESADILRDRIGRTIGTVDVTA